MTGVLILLSLLALNAQLADFADLLTHHQKGRHGILTWYLSYLNNLFLNLNSTQIMKKNLVILAIVAILSATFFFSCEKENKKTALSVESPELKTQNAIINMAIGIIDLAQKPVFKSEVTKKALKMFDDDNDVLFRDLRGGYNSSGNDFESDVSNSIKKYGTTDILSKILDMEPSLSKECKFDSSIEVASIEKIPYNGYITQYLQIYIPFVTKLT